MNNISGIPWHPGMKFIGQSLNWLYGDSEENYNNLIKNNNHKSYFEKLGWSDPNSITYKINEFGFRGELPDLNNCIVTLGCSYTMGLGLPESDIWPTLLGNELKLSVLNVAWPGISADTCFRLAYYYIPKFRPKLVVFLAPPENRIEITRNSKSTTLTVQITDEFDRDLFLKEWFLNAENSKLNSLKNKLAVKELCNLYSIPCLTYSSARYMSKSRAEIGYARDYQHAGPNAHKKLVHDILADCQQRSIVL